MLITKLNFILLYWNEKLINVYSVVCPTWTEIHFTFIQNAIIKKLHIHLLELYVMLTYSRA